MRDFRRCISGLKQSGSLPERLTSERNAAGHPLEISGNATIRHANFMMSE